MSIRKVIALACLIVFIGITLFIIPETLSDERTDDTLPLDSHFNVNYKDDLSGILDRRYIRVLTTFNKTNFFLHDKKFFGFEYSLLKEYEKFLNRGIKRRDLKVVMEFIPVTRDQLIPYLVNGSGDIAAAGLTITSERLKEVDFTNPYITGIDEVIVINKSVKGINSVEDLSGRQVFVRRSSSYYESLVLLNKEFIKKGIQEIKIVKVDETLETEDILELVNSGAIEITVSDSHIAKIWSRILDNLKVLYHLKVRVGSKIAYMVRKGNPELKENLNKFIKKHRKGTLLGNIYFNRYYKNNKWIKNPLTSDERKKQEHYVNLFKKYASKYRFDWMLIMALAYQESGLDHSKKSPFGAVGIMQVLPSSARDIGINNVHLDENNIHAGVKYLAFLRDRYFNDAEILERDKVRFTLASYNAGPYKIKKVRKMAYNMGLNHYKWFRNAEMAALKIIGQETVRYVSNINKYYVLFRLASENEKLRDSVKKKVTDPG